MTQPDAQANTAELIARMKDKLARVRQLREQSSQQLANVSQLSEQVKALEASATSADRTVTVTAGPGGSVKAVRLTDDAMRASATQLSQTITSTIQQAVAEAARQQATIMQENVGEQGTRILDRVLATQAEQFGMSVEELKAQTGTTTATPPPSGEEQAVDYSQQTVLRDGDTPGRPAPPPAPDDGSAGDQFLKNLFDDEGDR